MLRTVSHIALISGTLNWVASSVSVGEKIPPEVEILM